VTRYITLAEYLVITELATGFAAEDLLRSGRLDLADSALHAPQAGFDDQDFYPDIYDKAAVLCWRLARNHPLSDGNKRAAWATLTLFIDLNDGHWDPEGPDVDDAERTMVAVAAGEIDEAALANWLRGRVSFGRGVER
jgi:death-on-curing protein